jgi:hypothetical protein
VLLLWAVPVVAASVGVAVLLSRVRVLEDLSIDVLVAVHRTGELREPLQATRREMNRSGTLVERVWSHWTDPDDDEPGGAEERPGSTAPGS